MTRDELKEIRFTDEEIVLEKIDGTIKSLPLERFPRLKKAAATERKNYTLSPLGIHWEAIDEDISFDGFFTYNNEEIDNRRNAIQELIKKFPMLNLSELAIKAGISPIVMRHYACNVKRPSPARKAKIEKTLHQIGNELMNVHL